MTQQDDKLRGGYYTPSTVSSFLAKWAIRSKEATVLEPSCGNGSIIAAAASRLRSLGASRADIDRRLDGVELIAEEAEKAASFGGNILCGDFFSFCAKRELKSDYEVVVGNPPFIRYQDFKDEYREVAFSLMRARGFSPNRLTNIWIPFLVL